jgi:flagellar L-ring protein FlgH
MKKPFWWCCRVFVMGVALVWVAGDGSVSRADSLWREESSQALFADRRAYKVGDILTILVQESNRATKDNSTETTKKTGLDAGVQAFFNTAASKLPSMKVNSSHEFTGGGKINNSEQITTRIAVRVADVLPNGNLVIEGTRHIQFAGESQDATLQGVIRAVDVAANNTVFSFNIADAKIKYLSKGSVTDSQRKGWFTKIWGKLSPF